MKLNLVPKLIPALLIAAGLCIGCGGDHDHDHEPGHDDESGHGHSKPEKTSSADDGYPLKICLVSDEGLTSMGEPFVHVWNGTTVKFCCKGCLEDFEKEPKKFLAKLDAAKKGGSPKSEKETEKPVKPAEKE